MEETKQFGRQVEYCMGIFTEIKNQKHQYFSRQMVHNLGYLLHHHFLLSTYQSEILFQYLQIFVNVAPNSDIQLLADAIHALHYRRTLALPLKSLLKQKFQEKVDSSKTMKISSFYPSSESKDKLVVEVMNRFKSLTNFNAQSDFLAQIMHRIDQENDFKSFIQAKSGDLQKFIEYCVIPVINQAKEDSEVKQAQALKEVAERISGSPINLQKSGGQQSLNKQKSEEKGKKKQKKNEKPSNFQNIIESLEVLIPVIESQDITKQEVNLQLSELHQGELTEKIQEQLFSYLDQKASGKLSLVETGGLKRLVKGIRKQGWMENFRLNIIRDKLKKFESKQVYRGMKEDEKELGRVAQKLKTDTGYIPKFIRRLEKDMMEVFEENRTYDRSKAVDVTLKRQDRRELRIQNAIQGVVDDDFQEEFQFTLQPFGSYVNQFHMQTSDIDVAIVCPLSRRKEISLLEKLAFDLNSKQMAHNIEVITRAKVPIIRFTDSITSISIDLSCNNLLGSVNSLLINAYRQFDQRVHILGISLKAVLKRYGILGSGNGLSSYAYILMLIAFLQKTSPPILPNLQSQSLVQKDPTITQKVKKMEFQRDGSMISSLNTVHCTDLEFALEQGLGGEEVVNEKFASQLLFLFFHFYTYEFKHNEQTVSVREGGFKTKAEEDQKFLFSIEDPFDPTNNPGKLVKIQSPLAEKLISKFILIMKRIRQNQSIFS